MQKYHAVLCVVGLSLVLWFEQSGAAVIRVGGACSLIGAIASADQDEALWVRGWKRRGYNHPAPRQYSHLDDDERIQLWDYTLR